MGDLQWPQSLCLRKAPQRPGLHVLLSQDTKLNLRQTNGEKPYAFLICQKKKKNTKKGKSKKLGQPNMKEYMGYL